jgi:hypothetical protein
MTEILLWTLLFFGSGFAGGFLGVVSGTFAVWLVKRRRRMPTWAAHRDWRGL